MIAEVEVDAAQVSAAAARDERERGAIGRRDRSLVSLRRGKYSRHRLPGADTPSTSQSTPPSGPPRRAPAGARPLAIATGDVRRKVREHRVPTRSALSWTTATRSRPTASSSR